MKRFATILILATLLVTTVTLFKTPARARPFGSGLLSERGGTMSAAQSRSAGAAQVVLPESSPWPSSPTDIFLPLVDKRTRSACSVGSPFSLQIAALHQVEPGSHGQAGGGSSTETEWQAWYTQSFPSLVAALQGSGACWARLLIDWELIEPDPPVPGQPPVYDWSYHDPKVELVAEAGVHIIGTIEMVPYWARAIGGDPPLPDLRCTAIDPQRLPDFTQFLTDLVNRYKEPPYNIHTWELRNEPDGTTEDRANVGQGCAGFYGDLYAQMLAAAYPAIKAADPTATVLMGGVAYDAFTEYGGPFNRYFPDDVMANQGADFLDGITFHYFRDYHLEWERWVPNGNPPTCGIVDDGLGEPYDAWGIDLIAKTNHFRNRLATCFGVQKPVWVTELAEHGFPDDPDSLAQQARYVIQGHARGLAAGVQNITWFALVSPPYDDQQQGLLYYDELGELQAKPAYYAYRTLAAELTGWQYSATLNADDLEGYVFGRAGQEKTVAWGSGTLTFAPAGLLRVVSRTGAVSWIEDGGPGDLDGMVNGSVQVQLTEDPTFLSKE